MVAGIWLNRRPALSTADFLTRHVVSAHDRGGVKTHYLMSVMLFLIIAAVHEFKELVAYVS